MRKLLLSIFCLHMLVLLNPVCVAADFAEAQVFWRSFREAVLGGNSKQIASMTLFPFEVRGVDDSDPVKRYGRQAFAGIYNEVVSQQVIVMTGKEFLEKSMFQVIHDKNELNPTDMATPDYFTVELFNFRFIKGRWLFTRAYLEAP